MRTFAARERDIQEARYIDPEAADPTTPDGATAILASRGGKQAARHALAALWRAAQAWREGYEPTAKIPAPLRVLQALETLRLIERATDDRGEAIRFRLTAKGIKMAENARSAR
jgi:hypothetical protein